jgi:hypothetical protein
VSFAGPTTVGKVWFSDLFASEDDDYGASESGGGVNFETAAMQLINGGAISQTLTVNGEVDMPDDPFNENVWSAFLEDGDLFRRVVIQGQSVTVQVPSLTDNNTEVINFYAIGSVDPAKRAIFEDVETVEVDLTTILQNFNNVPVYAAGTVNADRVQAILAKATELEAVRTDAVAKRSIGDWPNGEIGAELAAATALDGITFFSPFGSSNEFSVAGLVIRN